MTNWAEADESGLAIHMRFPLTADGQGPATGEDFDHWGCWCSDPGCPGPPPHEMMIVDGEIEVCSACINSDGYPIAWELAHPEGAS